MLILRFYTPRNVPLRSIHGFVAEYMTGNDLRAILNRHIDENLILNVAWFEWQYAMAFRRDFIEPCLTNGYPTPGLHTTTSKLLYGKEVKYLVDVIPYSRRLDYEQELVRWDNIKTVKGVARQIINELKYGNRR